ncbi:MAG: putative addiction module antidote protein [Oligoflexia bacterium]|nr:putative addiction module antidote protein [Oligoflexia bacterium]
MKRKKINFKQDFYKELEDAESAEAYLNDAMKSKEASTILLAIRDLAKVRGIAEVAKKTGIQREHLYTILSEHGNPTLDSFNSIMNALGYELQVRKKASGD